MIRKQVTRTRGDVHVTGAKQRPVFKPREWCRLEVTLQPIEGMKTGRLSICGSAGYILTRAQARREALESWISFFEDNVGELYEMNKRCGTKFRTARTAAKYVVATDGEFHGIDAHEGDDGKIYVTTSCGQIREEILSFFPEAAPFMRWHLNDMRPSKAIPAREEACVNAWGKATTRTVPGVPEGATWEREELPPEVVAWVESL